MSEIVPQDEFYLPKMVTNGTATIHMTDGRKLEQGVLYIEAKVLAKGTSWETALPIVIDDQTALAIIDELNDYLTDQSRDAGV